mgnify:CR=1 FL=1
MEQARAVANLASVLAERGRVAAAVVKYEVALGLLRELGDSAREARVLNHVTVSCMALKRYAEALRHAARHASLVAGDATALSAIAQRIAEIKRLLRAQS